MDNKVSIQKLATGVPGLDAILGGGVPELSLNLIVGTPGTGKTTLAHQIMFNLATPERPALFFSALGEPALKMLRYQQQFSFFDASKIGTAIHFFNLSDDVSTGDFDPVLAHIVEEVEAISPALVFIDSFRSIMVGANRQREGAIKLKLFLRHLGLHFASWDATTFLIGEFPSDSSPPPLLTVADGVLVLEQHVARNSMVRKMQVLKMRGEATLPGIHTFRITQAGIEVFPAAVVRDDGGEHSQAAVAPPTRTRQTMGVPGLDEMLGGGLPAGYSILVAGPSGSGKTILATAFLVEGVLRGEAGIVVAFEQTPSQSWTRTIDELVSAGRIGLINTRSLDLSIDEIVQRLVDMIQTMNAKRVVIDSLSGFKLAVAPSFREDFRESLFRMISVLSGIDVTVLMTSELEDRYTDLRFSPNGSAFLTDAIIVQRYIEVESCLKRVMAVVKVRGSAHSNELRQYEIVDGKIVIGTPLTNYEGLLGGRPTQSKASDADTRGSGP